MIYEFKCETCKHEFEIQCMVSEYDKYKMQSCPKCKSEKVNRVISPVAIRFGRGFFKDGYESAKKLTSNSDGE
tara:strand:+ start:993 stop:1211 length:219 start_codon:yes stop_codon:yes gene_type:complete